VHLTLNKQISLGIQTQQFVLVPQLKCSLIPILTLYYHLSISVCVCVCACVCVCVRARAWACVPVSSHCQTLVTVTEWVCSHVERVPHSLMLVCGYCSKLS